MTKTQNIFKPCKEKQTMNFNYRLFLTLMFLLIAPTLLFSCATAPTPVSTHINVTGKLIDRERRPEVGRKACFIPIAEIRRDGLIGYVTGETPKGLTNPCSRTDVDGSFTIEVDLNSRFIKETMKRNQFTIWVMDSRPHLRAIHIFKLDTTNKNNAMGEIIVSPYP